MKFKKEIANEETKKRLLKVQGDIVKGLKGSNSYIQEFLHPEIYKERDTLLEKLGVSLNDYLLSYNLYLELKNE